MLQRERPFGEQAVVELRGLLAVEDHGDLPSLGGDFEGVPFAARFGHRVHLDEMDDPAGAVGRVRALVENVHLIAGPVGDCRGILAANEDAAVGIVARPELDVHLEVLVFGLGDQMRGGLARAFVGDDRAVLDPPVGLTDAVPFAADGLAVEQRDPARAGLTRGPGRGVDGDGCDDEPYGKGECACRYALHRDLLPLGRRWPIKAVMSKPITYRLFPWTASIRLLGLENKSTLLPFFRTIEAERQVSAAAGSRSKRKLSLLHLTRKRAELLAHIQNTNSQYNLPEIGKKLAYKANRDGVVERFSDPAVQKSVEVDLALIGSYDQLLSDMELTIVQTAKQHDAHTLYRLQSVPGIGKILSLVLLYEIHDISRFPRVQDFVSYCRLVKCAQESAGQTLWHLRREDRQCLSQVGVF